MSGEEEENAAELKIGDGNPIILFPQSLIGSLIDTAAVFNWLNMFLVLV